MIKSIKKTYLGLETCRISSSPAAALPIAMSAFVGYRGPALAVVGFRGPVLAFVGLHRLWWPVVSLRGTPVGLQVVVGLRLPSWACVGFCHSCISSGGDAVVMLYSGSV